MPNIEHDEPIFPCDSCNGAGTVFGPPTPCDDCGGTGEDVRRLRAAYQGAVEAFAALEWNVQNGYDERSPVIVSRDSFERLRRALVRGR